LNIDGAVTAPIRRSKPELTWVEARESKVLPESVFRLYTHADYLSFGAAPPFLADADNVIFSYFGIVLESLRDSLVEAEEHRRLFVEADSRIYDPGKNFRREPWDQNADKRANRKFRFFLVSQQAALDALADLTAIILTGLIHGLQVGRAQFRRIESWLNRPLPVMGLIGTPQQYFLQQLYDLLRPVVYPDPPERDWLQLMRLYRNKGAHLGSSVFRWVGLHDGSGKFYRFLSRQWPYIWEKDIKPAGQTPPPNESAQTERFRKDLMHRDVISYVEGLRNKVANVIDAGASVLGSAYRQFKDFPLNKAALSELQGSSEGYTFE
jgi:hypothetical protein